MCPMKSPKSAGTTNFDHKNVRLLKLVNEQSSLKKTTDSLQVSMRELNPTHICSRPNAAFANAEINHIEFREETQPLRNSQAVLD